MKKTLLLILSFVSGYGMVSAQQRLVILEHFTQASCGPCASQNPALKAVLDQNLDKIVAIKYQTSWPGTDPMNTANPTDVATRVSYYTVSGVPNSVMDGNFYKGAPSGVTQTRINQRQAVPASFKTSVNYQLMDDPTSNNDSVFVYVKLKALSNVPAGYRLQTAVIEREIEFATPPGTNGEKKFESVMKKMLPNASGTTLPAFVAGDSAQFFFKWLITKTNGSSVFYNAAQVAAVAFVQNNATKEILNGAYDAPRPWLTLSKAVGTKGMKIKSADDVSYPVEMVSKTDLDQTIKIKATVTGLPANWAYSMTDGINTFSDTGSISLPANGSKTLTLKVSGPNAGILNKKASIKLEAYSASINPSVKSVLAFGVISPTSILFMDQGASALARFTSAFQASSLQFLALTAEESGDLDPTGFDVTNVKKVYYSCGASFSGTVNEEKAGFFTSYLNSGGNLFIVGQDIGYEVDIAGNAAALDFYNNYMGAEYVGDGTTAAVIVKAQSTDPLIAPFFTGSVSLSGTNSYPDQLALSQTTPDARDFLVYGTGNSAAIYNSADNWKVVYVGFRLEGLSNTGIGLAFRNALVRKSHDWFDGILTSNEMAKQIQSIGNAYPNPAKGSLYVPVFSGKGSIRLTNISGQVLRSNVISGSENSVQTLSLDGIKAGFYFLQTESNGVKSEVQKIVVE